MALTTSGCVPFRAENAQLAEQLRLLKDALPVRKETIHSAPPLPYNVIPPFEARPFLVLSKPQSTQQTWTALQHDGPDRLELRCNRGLNHCATAFSLCVSVY